MAVFIDALRGDGLVRAQRALAGLQEDPMLLRRARERFCQSPPSYTSDQSGTTTQFPSPIPSGEERYRDRRSQLGWEYGASRPDRQFSHQINVEDERIMEAHMKRIRSIPVGSDAHIMATEIVRKRWEDQGLWSSKWSPNAFGLWKHEEPLEIETESESDPETDKSRQIAERRITREREREASRPYRQFFYQISIERERIQEESGSGQDAWPLAINTTAYENVKDDWIKQGIWNKKWGILPGMSWKNEQPFEDFFREEVGAEFVAMHLPEQSDNEAPGIQLFSSRPAQRSHNLSPGTLNVFHQGQLADMTFPGSHHYVTRPPSAPTSPPPSAGERVLATERSPSASNSTHPSLARRVPRASRGQVVLSNKKKASHKARQLANVSPGLVHALKVTKSTGKRRGPTQGRLNMLQEVSFYESVLSSGVNVAELRPSPPPEDVTPRRSKRLQQSTSSKVGDPTKTASTKRPRREITSSPTIRKPAKLQGVTKRPPAKTTRGKARKK